MAISSVCFSHDANLLATGSWDRMVVIYEVNPDVSYNNFGRQVLKLDAGFPVTSVKFNNDSRRLASASENKDVVLWDTDFDGTGVIKTERLSSKDENNTSKNSQNRTTNLGDRIGTYSSHAKSVTCICYSLDGTKLATVSEDHTAIIWNVDPSITNEESHLRKLILKDHHNGVTCVDFNIDAKLMATGSHDHNIILYLEKQEK